MAQAIADETVSFVLAIERRLEVCAAGTRTTGQRAQGPKVRVIRNLRVVNSVVVYIRSFSESLQLTLSEQRKRAASSGRIADPS